MRMRKSAMMATSAISVLCLAGMMGAAFADSAAGPDVETIVVTGYRGSLQKSLDMKRAALGSQDSIVADDIAAFPDLNLAESMQRIPGVAITRDSGEGRQITLRGLGPDFTRTQMNGMEVLSNTASGMDNRGAVSRTRSFDFSMFASELFDRVTVQKSYSADQDEGGLAGTVQLYTAHPFDYDGFKAVVSAKAMTNSNTGTITPRVVGLISDRVGSWGVLFSAAFSTNDSNEYGYRNWAWYQPTVKAANIGAGVTASDAARLQSSSVYSPQAMTYSTWYDHRERLGLTGAVQYRPADNFEAGLDVMYGRLINHRNDYALAVAGANGLSSSLTGTQLINAVTIDNKNSIVAGSYSHVDLRSENNEMRDKTNFYQVVGNAKYSPLENLTITALFGYSKSDYQLPEFDKVFLEAKNHSFSFDYSAYDHPVNQYDFDPADASAWNLMRMDTQENRIGSDYVNGKLDVDWAVDEHSTLKAGGAYKKFYNMGWNRANKVNHNSPADTVIPAEDKLTVPHDTDVRYTVGDIDKTFAYIGQIRDLTPAYDVAGSNYKVDEITFAGYGEYVLRTELFGLPLRANAGVRYFATDITSAGNSTVSVTTNGVTSAVLVPVVIRHHYNDLLPSLNVAVDLSDSLVARISADRNISRPALGDLAAAGTLTTAPFGGTISAGNPNLKPFKADSAEMSLEYYEDKSGYLSIGGFYKNMQDYITSTTKMVPYSSTGFPVSLLFDPSNPDVLYNYTAPVNGKGASIIGLEAAMKKDFTFLPAPFDHLGFTGNLTLADGSSDVTISNVAYSLPLYNLSKLSTNATLYYETDVWGVRISDAYRGKYYDGAGSNGNIGSGYRSTHNIDFAAHYNIAPNLKLVVEGVNLTDQPIIQFTDAKADRLLVKTSSGSTYTLGLTYDF